DPEAAGHVPRIQERRAFLVPPDQAGETRKPAVGIKGARNRRRGTVIQSHPLPNGGEGRVRGRCPQALTWKDERDEHASTASRVRHRPLTPTLSPASRAAREKIGNKDAPRTQNRKNPSHPGALYRRRQRPAAGVP